MEVQRFDSSDKSVKKYVFNWGNEVMAEAVLYGYPTYEDRTVMCISTMTGCPVGCTFCGSGGKFINKLDQLEMLEQIHHILVDQNIDPHKVKKLQIMFMSMGEPFLNYQAVARSIELIHEQLPCAELLVSTMAPDRPREFGEFMGLSKKIPTVGLQFSIHESSDVLRNKLIPYKQKLNLDQIALLGTKWWLHTGRKPFFNYCVTKENTGWVAIEGLLKRFFPQIWNATISVVCEKDQSISDAENASLDLAQNFANELLTYGYNVRVFNPAGQDDIGGGCGQLWHFQRQFTEDAETPSTAVKPTRVWTGRQWEDKEI